MLGLLGLALASAWYIRSWRSGVFAAGIIGVGLLTWSVVTQLTALTLGQPAPTMVFNRLEGPSLALSGPVASLGIGRRKASTSQFSCFVRLWKSEADSKHPVLLAHGPCAGKAEALAQPQHGLEALDRASRRVERAEAAHPRHRPLHPEVVALDPLLQMLGNGVDRRSGQQARLPALGDGPRVGAGAIRADAVWGEQRLGRKHLANEALGRIEIAVGSQQEVDRVPVLIDGPV